VRLIEHFLSIQGEGLHPGRPAYFVRFARCNLSCVWCDSTYSFGKGASVSLRRVARSIRKSRAEFVCLTGGEPLLHLPDCLRLIRRFPRLHFDVETGGSLDIRPVQKKNTSVIMDWKLEHSGMTSRMRPANLRALRPSSDLLKLVTDFSSAEVRQIRRLLAETERSRVRVSLQPVYGVDPRGMTEWAVARRDPRIQVNLQIHKIIWGPDRRGV